MPALASRVILNEESQAHRRIFDDHALNAELLLRGNERKQGEIGGHDTDSLLGGGLGLHLEIEWVTMLISLLKYGKAALCLWAAGASRKVLKSSSRADHRNPLMLKAT